MRADADFFSQPPEKLQVDKSEVCYTFSYNDLATQCFFSLPITMVSEEILFIKSLHKTSLFFAPHVSHELQRPQIMVHVARNDWPLWLQGVFLVSEIQLSWCNVSQFIGPLLGMLLVYTHRQESVLEQ